MAAPQRNEVESLHPTLDSDFRDKQYDRKNIFAGNTNASPAVFGIQKAQKVVRMNDYIPTGKKREPLPQIKAFANEPWQPGPEFQPTPANIGSAPQKSPSNTKTATPEKKSGLMQKVVAARAILTGVAALSWTGWLWLTVQLPFAIFSLLSLGLWFYSEETWWLNSTIGVVEWFLSWFGVQVDIFSGIFFINWVVVMFVGALAIGGVLLQFLISLLRPLSGQSSDMKMISICCCFIGYAIPGANMFPWIWIYIFIVMRYPK